MTFTLQATVRIVYDMKVALDDYFLDIEECAADLAQYITAVYQWPDPILPGTTECTAMEQNPGPFTHDGSRWICPQSQEEDG